MPGVPRSASNSGNADAGTFALVDDVNRNQDGRHPLHRLPIAVAEMGEAFGQGMLHRAVRDVAEGFMQAACYR